MGSAEEPETLQLLKPEAVPQDAPQPSPSSPCRGEKGSCLQNVTCGGGDLTMRNCCISDLGAKGSSQGGTMVDNPDEKEKALGADQKPSVDLASATDAVALKDAGAGASPSGGEREITASGDVQRNSRQASDLKELPGSSAKACSPLERKASPVAGEACKLLLAESCLKGANKDPPSASGALKHVAFLEPTTHKPEAETVQATELACSKGAPALPAGLQNTSQGQPPASEGDPSPPGRGNVCEAVVHLTEGHGDPPAPEATQESVPEPPGAKTTPGKPGEAVTERDRLGPSRGGCSTVPEVLVAAVPLGISGESPTHPGEATKGSETDGLRESAAPSSTQHQTRAQEQQTLEAASTAMSEEQPADVQVQPVELLTKACSFEVTPPQQDAGTQAGHRVSLVSVAISPINPPDGSTAFTFHAGGLAPHISLKSPTPEQKPAKKDVEMQVSIPVETRSVATGPMTPVTKSPEASYPEVHVKGAQEETPEPVREVSWDEKGMTWEVYGASMEVEVLGMAIQKHLEKQIEEHGRQTVMTPQSTRSSSIKGPTHKGEVKRQPSVFRALLQNVRRPRCCSRGGPAVE